MTPPFPPTIGRYDIRRDLAREPSGVLVLLAHDRRLDRDVTLKVLPDSWLADAERRNRFERDVRIVAGIANPHVATIHSFEQDGTRHFLTMELVPGRTLRDVIAADPPSLLRALRHGRDIAEALVAAHARRVLHRGLDPDRVIVTPDGVAKVTDFGLEAAGASPYTSPEQHAGRDPDVRSDVFAFGAVLLTCLAGRSPFRGTTPEERIAHARDTGIDPALVLPGELSPSVRALLTACVSPDPADRPASMRPLRDAIRDALTQLAALEQTHTRRGALRVPGNVPARVDGFVGGDRVEAVAALVAAHRLVTLTGAPGVGKSRLALEVAHALAPRFEPNGLWLVDVSEARSPADVRAHVERTLSGATPGLLVLDGADHATDGVCDLLKGAGDAHVLVTSRAPVGADGECVHRVPPLPDEEALTLLVACAHATGTSLDPGGPDRPTLLGVCRKTDGLPLAIQLAAGRLRSLPPAALLERLDDPLRVLGSRTPGPTPHHRSMRDAIAWTADLLTHTDRALLAALSTRPEAVSSSGANAGAADVERLLRLGFLEPESKRLGADVDAEPRIRVLNVIRSYISEP